MGRRCDRACRCASGWRGTWASWSALRLKPPDEQKGCAKKPGRCRGGLQLLPGRMVALKTWSIGRLGVRKVAFPSRPSDELRLNFRNTYREFGKQRLLVFARPKMGIRLSD